MSYEPQEFIDDATVLQANHMNHIESGIINNETAIDNLQEIADEYTDIVDKNSENIEALMNNTLCYYKAISPAAALQGYWQNNNGVVEQVVNTNIYTRGSDPIPVQEGDFIQIMLCANRSGNETIIFVNEENGVYHYINGENYASPSDSFNFISKTYLIQSGVTHVLFNCYLNVWCRPRILFLGQKEPDIEPISFNQYPPEQEGDLYYPAMNLITRGKYLVTNKEAGEQLDLTYPKTTQAGQQVYWNSVVLETTPGEQFTINAAGGETAATLARLWCFVDENDVCLSVADGGVVGKNLVLTAPEGAAKLVLNMRGEMGLCCRGVTKEGEKTISESESLIQPFYLLEMEDTIAKVRNEIDAPALVFPWATDIHQYSSHAKDELKNTNQNFDDMINNIKYFAQQVPCDFLLNTGDNTDGARKVNTIKRANKQLASFLSIGLPYVFALGNHDTNYMGSGTDPLFSLSECYKYYFTQVKADSYHIVENGTNYYIDYDDVNVRIIVLNANNVREGQTHYHYTSETNEWLQEVLDLNKKNLLVIHSSPYMQSSTADTVKPLIRDTIAEFVDDGGSVIILCGHTHKDIAYMNVSVERPRSSREYPCPVFVCACQRFVPNLPEAIYRTNDEEYDCSNTDQTGFIYYSTVPGRVADSYTMDLWTVAVYKPFTNEMSLIRFGGGHDRYYHLTPIEPCSLTTKLSGTITWTSSNNNVATVIDGDVIPGSQTGNNVAIIAEDEENNYECWIVNVPNVPAE